MLIISKCTFEICIEHTLSVRDKPVKTNPGVLKWAVKKWETTK